MLVNIYWSIVQPDEIRIFEFIYNPSISSPADIHTNLNGALTKASVTKALDKLAEQDLAISKTYGKSVIYSIAQVKHRTKRSSNALEGVTC